MPSYDLSDKLQIKKAQAYFDKMIEAEAFIELTRKGSYSYKQHRYAIALIKVWAVEYGYTFEHAKQTIKREIRFVEENDHGIFLKSLSKKHCSPEELALFIDKFREWSDSNGLYLMTADEYKDKINEVERKLSHYASYLKV